jgi:hypothetical protein
MTRERRERIKGRVEYSRRDEKYSSVYVISLRFRRASKGRAGGGIRKEIDNKGIVSM